MFPATSMAGGMLMSSLDVCKTPAPPAPPIPIPYPNMGQCATLTGTEPKVMVMNMPIAVQTSKTAMSQGDTAGVAGGVTSGMIMGPIAYSLASQKVKAGGKGVVYATCMTGHNGSSPNDPTGLQSAPSQTKVLVG